MNIMKYSHRLSYLLILLSFASLTSCKNHQLIVEPETQTILVQQRYAAPPLKAEGIDGEATPLNLTEVKMTIGYPQEARDLGEQGQILLKVTIDENGDYVEHELLDSASEILAQQVEGEIWRVKFEPGLKDGKPVPFTVEIPFNFKLLK